MIKIAIAIILKINNLHLSKSLKTMESVHFSCTFCMRGLWLQKVEKLKKVTIMNSKWSTF